MGREQGAEPRMLGDRPESVQTLRCRPPMVRSSRVRVSPALLLVGAQRWPAAGISWRRTVFVGGRRPPGEVTGTHRRAAPPPQRAGPSPSWPKFHHQLPDPRAKCPARGAPLLEYRSSPRKSRRADLTRNGPAGRPGPNTEPRLPQCPSTANEFSKRSCSGPLARAALARDLHRCPSCQGGIVDANQQERPQ